MRAAAILFLLLFVTSARADPKGKALPLTGEAQAKLAAFDKLLLDYLAEQKAPGAALAIAKDGRLVYARGFGYADTERKLAVQPTSLFRLASASKPMTVAAVCQLIERGKLKPDDKIFDILQLKDSSRMDGRWKKITVQQLVGHRAGFDRESSGDPMFKSLEIAKALKIQPPPKADQIIKYMLAQPIEHEPGTKEVYSNFGYCLLGRVIEKAGGKPYDKYVIDELLKPIGIQDMQMGKTLSTAKGEVRYYETYEPTGPSVFASLGTRDVPSPYGAWCLEAMDAHGGWIASAIDLARFGSVMDYPDRFPAYKGMTFKYSFFPEYVHYGAISGSSAMFRRFANGVNVGLLFNSRKSTGEQELCQALHDRLKDLIDKVESWPDIDLFPKYLGK